MRLLAKITFLATIFFSQLVNALTIAIPASTPSMLVWVDVLEEIYKRAGIPLDFVTLPTQRAFSQSSNGVIDGELARIHKVGDLYPTLIRVPTPFGFFESRAFSKDPDIQTVIDRDGWDAMRNFRVGIVRGMKFAEEVDTKDWQNLEVVTGTDQLFKMLSRDRIDIAISTKVSGLTFVKEFDLKSIHMLTPVIRRHDLYHYLHEKNQRYVPILDRTIRAMKESGELLELDKKFTAERLGEK